MERLQPDNQPIRTRWDFLKIGGLIVLTFVAYAPSSAALWDYWTGMPSLGGHGPLVVALSAWLLIRARPRLALAVAKPEPRALLLTLALSLLSLLFWKAGLQALQLLVMPALMLAAVVAAFGIQVGRIAAVPIGYLYFAMPAWNLLIAPLQALTVQAVRILAPVLGVPATVTGTLISFPDGTGFEVTPACSGVGFLVEGLAVAVLLGELEQSAPARRVRLVIAMFLVAILTNWVRVLALIEVGYATEMRHVLVTQHHLTFGWVLFVAVLLLFVALAARWRAPAPSARPAGTVTAARGAHVGSNRAYAATIAALLAGPVLVSVLLPAVLPQRNDVELLLPAARNEWHGPTEHSSSAWAPEFVGEHTVQRAAYEDTTGREVEIVAIGYTMQEQGRELVNEGNSLLGSSGLRPLSTQLVSIEGNRYWEVVTVDEHGDRSVIWCVYDIGGRPFVVPILAQLWYGARALVRPPYSALLAFRTPCSATCEAARTTLFDFARGMGQEVIVAATRESRSKERRPARA